ncbi:YhgE/Pip family protein [Cellulomonas sp. NPDC057328]|uniref:YhgE/Pip domain-containing protein n=1 Tax=Cellulomonas sp. NPDC057328 TaxID=3346101 RepID=UPI003636247D
MSTTTTARRWPAVVVALAAPLALALVLLAGTWDPAARLDRVQAAVVNEDEPVTLDGQYTPLGRQLAGALTEGEGAAATYDWVVTDDEDAAAGLAAGTYAAVVTIPSGFSAAATSFAAPDGTPRQATVEVTTPDRSTAVDEAVARAVTATATQVLGRQLTTTYLENVLVGFSTLQDQLGQAADGATQLADGARSLADGNAQLADGAGDLAGGTAELAAGVDELGGGARELAAGTGTLAGGARQLADGAEASAAGARQLADGLGQLARGTDAQPGGTGALAAGGAQLAQGAATFRDALAPGLGQVATQLDGVATTGRQTAAGSGGAQEAVAAAVAAEGCTPASSDVTCGALLAAQQQLAVQAGTLSGIADGADQIAAQLRPGGGAAPTAVDRLVAGAGELATGAQGLAAGTASVDAGVQQLSTGATELADGLGTLAGGARDLSGGAAELATGTRTLASGVGALGSGADQVASGTAQLADGARAATDGATQLADGTAEIGTGLGDAVAQLPVTPEDERAALADVVATPVAAPATSVAGPLGPVSALTAVALWVGALALFLAFPPLPRRVAGSTRSALGTVLGALALPAALGAVQGAVVGAVVGGVTGQGAGRTVGLAVVGLLAGVVLAAFHQAVAAWTGTGGRVAAVVAGFVFLVAGLAATVPDWVAATVGWLPLAPVADAVGGVVGDGSSTAGALVVLVVWGAASLAATAGAVARTRAAYGRRTVAALA